MLQYSLGDLLQVSEFQFRILTRTPTEPRGAFTGSGTLTAWIESGLR